MNFFHADEAPEEEIAVNIFVSGLPPYQGTPGAPEPEPLRERVRKLKEAAQRAYARPFPLGDPVYLGVHYQRGTGRGTAQGIVAGIADALRKLVFTEKELVTQVHYAEHRGDDDRYWVEVRRRQAPAPAHHH